MAASDGLTPMQRYYKKNRKKCRAANRRWFQKNKARRRNYNVRNQQRQRLRHKYKMTVQEFQDLLASQGNLCAICREPFENSKDTHVDHDHRTQEVRGILCYRCNHGLGKFKDDYLRLIRAAKYILDHREKGGNLGSAR